MIQELTVIREEFKSDLVIIKIFLFISFCLFLVQYTSGQSDYKEAFIITPENDTLHGFIKDEGEGKFTRYCLFRENILGDTRKYFPEEIKAFRFTSGPYYISKNIGSGADMNYIFVEFLVDGIVNLFFYFDEEGEHFLLEKEGEYFQELKNTQNIIRVEGSDRIKESKEYLGFLNYAFRDYPEIQPKLNNLELSQNSLVRITRNYHDYVCTEDEPCVVYQKKIKPPVISYGIYSGIRFYRFQFLIDMGSSEVYHSIPVGVFFNSTLPYTRNRLSMQLELAFHTMKDVLINRYTLNSKSLNIPAQIRFSLPVKDFSPYLGAGIMVNVFLGSGFEYDGTDQFKFRSVYVGYFADGGLEYKINSKLSVFSTCRCQIDEGLTLGNPYYSNFRINSLSLLLGVKF